MKKNIILSIVFFALGFVTHALFFPEILANGITDIRNVAVPNVSPTSALGSQEGPLITKVEFDGKRFSKHNITVEYTRYLHIINTSKTEQMELIGTTKELTTPRPYGESEAIQTQFNQKGQFVVADKNNPNEKLVITVK